MSCVVSGGGLDIVLNTHSGMHAFVYLSSVFVHSLLLSLPMGICVEIPEGCKSYIGKKKYLISVHLYGVVGVSLSSSQVVQV